MRKRIILMILIILGGIALYGVLTQPKEPKIKEFSAFFDVSQGVLNEENDIKERIARITGARCEESWLVGQSRDTVMNTYIISGEYPDFISGSTELYQAGALIALDEYIDAYPNIKNYLEDYEWDKLRQEDGHIYWIPQFRIGNGGLKDMQHNGEAFWIQTRVLKWAGYPKVRTLEEYFDLIERYMEANPTMESGTPNIPYTILCDDWRYFCLENPPQFLDGYPNDGCCMVDTDTMTVKDYNVTPTAKEYFRILNEEYQKGFIDSESFTQTYEEYLTKLSTGAVLGMVDQRWQFIYEVEPALWIQGLQEEGCEYVPLPITIDEDTKNYWHVESKEEINFSSGVGITISCKDIEGALQFINDLLSPEVMRLRFWGVEGVDYEVDEKGRFYRTPKQRERAGDAAVLASHFCNYSYFPRIEGLSEDGMNAFSPEYQPKEVYDTFSQSMKECLAAYECDSPVEMLGSNEVPGPWFPMYSYTEMLTESTEAGHVYKNIEELKHLWLPQVVMAEDFEIAWKSYMEAYEECRPEILYEAMQKELERRISLAEGGSHVQ